MKILFILPVLLTGCITIHDILPPFDNPDKINETNYMKTPCIWDGAIVKKKPKVINVFSNDSNRIKER